MGTRRLFLMPLFAALGCGPTLDQYLLSIAVKPKPVRDDGTPALVTVNAVDPDLMPGRGSVRVQSSAGSLVDPVTLQLDAMGVATSELTCSLADDPGCAGSITITATWLSPKGLVKAETDTKILITDARTSACSAANQKPLAFLTSAAANIQLGLSDPPPESRPIGIGAAERGVAVYDATAIVAGLAITLPTVAMTVVEEEKRVRDLIATPATVINPLVRTFTTWDGYAGTRTSFDLAGTEALKARLDSVSTKLGGVATSISPSPATAKGPFKVIYSVVLRPGGQTAIAFALTPTATATDSKLRKMDDIAGGSALAASADTASASQCEVFTIAKNGKVDLVWVVDDSCSMATSQAAVATVGAQIANRLSGALIEFRSAGVSTGYFAPGFRGSVRDWTESTSTMLGWFSGAGAWGTGGSGSEQGFSGLDAFITRQSPIGALIVPGPPRPDADIHILFLTDAPEQSPLSAQQIYDELTATYPNQHITAHGILCPETTSAAGNDCGDGSMEYATGKYHELVRKTGGVLGSIRTFNTMTTATLVTQQADTMKAIVQSLISGAGLQFQHPPIGASLRVASSATRGSCENTDIPRDDDNGWQVDPTSGRLSFSGACVPPLGATVAVSYQYWTH